MSTQLYARRAGDAGQDPIEQLKKAIATYDTELAERAARSVVDSRIDPLTALDAMIGAIKLIGDGFSSGDLFLPDLVGAAAAMNAAAPILEQEIKSKGALQKGRGTVVIGTVFGDIHDIGKNMVVTFLRADGFTVHDVGINVKAERFVAAVEEHTADILAMSALLTTTAPEMKRVIAALESAGLRSRTRVMVGGGGITKAFAEGIGADGYGPTAPTAPALAKKLMED